jgi:hypothetical protein
VLLGGESLVPHYHSGLPARVGGARGELIGGVGKILENSLSDCSIASQKHHTKTESKNLEKP